MNRRLPPDRDSDLRHAISLDQDEQIRLLRWLAGEPNASASPQALRRRGTFTHYGATTKNGARGAYVYMPTPIPPNITDPDTNTVILTVDHGDLNRRVYPRHPTTIAKLKTAIETALPLRGTHELRIDTPPRQWTAAHLEWFARTMASYLPPSTTPSPIYFNMYGSRSSSVELSVRRHTGSAFSVSCDFSPIGLRRALDEWQRTTGGCSAVLGTEPLTAGPEPLDRTESLPDDDDLVAIEKACRRQLHGITHQAPSSNTQPGAQPPTQEVAGRTACNLLDIALKSPNTFHRLANLVDTVHRHYFSEGGQS